MDVAILAVDDSPANLRSMEAVLQGLGAPLVTAQSGEAALRQLLAREFALILLDIQMPDIDGYELARLIRGRESSRHTPIILVTAFDRQQTNVSRGYSLGAVDVLFKPVEPEVLKSKVQFFLDSYAKTQELSRQAERLRLVERREHERDLAEAKQRFEQRLLKEEAERERRVAEAHNAKARELERAHQAVHEKNQRLQLLANGARQLLATLEPREALAPMISKVADHLGLEARLLHLRDPGGEDLPLEWSEGLDPDRTAAFNLVRLDEGLLGQAASSRHERVATHVQGGGREELAALSLSMLVCFPLVTAQRLFGTLTLGTVKPRVLLEDELSTLQVFCDQIAVGLERAGLVAELQETDRRKNEFLAMLGHELRNPLAPIRNALEILRLRSGADQVLRRAVEASDRQVRHMTRLVDDLLDVSRISRGKVELRRARVDLKYVLEHALQGVEPILRERGHQLCLQLPEERLALDADASRLVQVFGNLLHNSAKYTGPGGQIRVSVAREGAEVSVQIADNGIGIRPAMLGRVFDIFVQEQHTAGGLGLGLTLVRSLVELHGGTVRASSAGLGKGSEFTVRLPLLVEVAEPAREPLEAMNASGLRRLSIFLVEDNADIRSTMSDLLQLCGHQVYESDDGLSAVEQILHCQPDVAVVDIGLPGLDGYAVAAKIRSFASGQRVRLVAVTGYGGADARERALASGFDEHLVKPLDLDSFWEVLRRLCERGPGKDSELDMTETSYADGERRSA